MRRWQLHQRYIAKHLAHPEAAVPRAARLERAAFGLARGLLRERGHWYARRHKESPLPSEEAG
jgi:hypothetical protein